ncbi:MAG: 4-vinyl reductase [Prolixibacteraceae bacterium]|nr:4-vinyl reductase [Prolixibacteraceae bacterium]
MLSDDKYSFRWSDIGDISLGRSNLGNTTNVAVYRLMQYTMRSVLNSRFGSELASEMFYESGKLAGQEFCKNRLNCNQPFNQFLAQLQEQMHTLNIGILRIEKIDLENMNFVLAVAEDLDCSGLPITNETVCDYDEGFFAGLLGVYTNKDFEVKEVDCWSKGDRVCRFTANLKV